MSLFCLSNISYFFSVIETCAIQKKRGKKRGLSERDNNANLGVGECVEYAVLCCYYLKKCWRRKISS